MESVDTQGVWEEERPKRSYWVYVTLFVCVNSLKSIFFYMHVFWIFVNVSILVFPLFFFPHQGQRFKDPSVCCNNHTSHSYELLSDISWYFMLSLPTFIYSVSQEWASQLFSIPSHLLQKRNATINIPRHVLWWTFVRILVLYALEGDCWICVDIMGVSIVSLSLRMTHH